MRKLFSLFILLFMATGLLVAQNITFRGNAPTTVAANERFQVTYTLRTGGEKGKEIRIPDVQGLQQLFGPSVRQQSSSVYDGNQLVTDFSNSYIYTYLAPETGTYTIPAATIKVGNSTYKSNELKIEVVASSQSIPRGNNNRNNAGSSNGGSNQSSISGEDVFVRMAVSKRKVFENEGFLVTFKVYSRFSSMGFRDAQFPNFEGFIAQEIEQPQDQQWNLETYNGRQYYTATLKQVILYPIKPGSISINSGKYEVEIARRVENDRVSFFDPIFKTETVRRSLSTPATTIDVQALPAGKPASFTGAVGNYSMTSSVTPQQLKTDEVVTVKVNISGSGNIKYVKNPTVSFPNDFDTLDPKITESSKVSQSGVTGSKSIEYYAIPRHAGTFTIPGIEFSYFDLSTQTYKTLSSGACTIKVEQGEGGSARTTIVAGANKEDVKYLGQDIRHIKTGNVSFDKGSYFWGTLSYWLWICIPIVLFIIFFIINRKQVKQNSDIALMRTKKANKVATKRLKLANKYLKENNKESFYEEISKAVWGYLGDKLNMPAAALTKDNIETELSSKEIDSTLTSQFIDILNTAEFARFAPSGGHEAMDELYRSAVNAIDKMESTIKK